MLINSIRLNTLRSNILLLSLIAIGLFIGLSIPALADTSSKRFLPIAHWQSNNQTPVYFVPINQNLPFIDIRLAFNAGSARDNAQQAGLAQITANMLAEGAGKFDTDTIALTFENNGAEFDVDTNRDMTLLSLRTLTKPALLAPVLNMFSTIVSQPNFPASNFDRIKTQTLAAIAHEQQDPNTLAQQLFYQLLFFNHPYGHNVLGTNDSINQITPDDLKQFHRHYYSARNATLVIVGAIERAQAEQIAEQITQQLPVGSIAPALPEAQPVKQAQTKTQLVPVKQTALLLGQLGIKRSIPEYFPLIVGNHILGGSGLNSRLNHAIREQRGLSYSVYSYFLPLLARGPFIVSLATRNQKADQALAITRETLHDFINKGPTNNELIAAQKNLIGSFPLKLDTNRAIADNLLVLAFYQLPLDYFDTYRKHINDVTVTQIRQALQHYLQPERMLTVKIAPATV
ncbi:MAG: pitrilysin family protein [Gammaproteobacteria bacterium]